MGVTESKRSLLPAIVWGRDGSIERKWAETEGQALREATSPWWIEEKL